MATPNPKQSGFTFEDDFVLQSQPEFRPMQLGTSSPSSSPPMDFSGYPQLFSQGNPQTSFEENNDPFELKEIPRSREPLPPSSSVKRCQRCAQYYSDEKEECRTHTGLFRATLGAPPHWSCCGSLTRDVLGCRPGKHIECVATSKVLQEYSQMVQQAHSGPTVPKKTPLPSLIDFNPPTEPHPPAEDPLGFLFTRKRKEEMELDSDEEEEKGDEEKFEGEEEFSLPSDPRELLFKENGSEFIRHPVLPTDTLSGLSLRYQVSPQEIQKVNNLFHARELCTRQWIRLPFRLKSLPPPLTPEQRKEWRRNRRESVVRKFVRVNGISRGEGEAYLRLHRFRYREAMQHWQEDSQWELTHPSPSPLSIPTQPLKSLKCT